MRSTGGRRRAKQAEEALLLGIGLDGDGEKRITRGPEMLLVGGTEETHEAMQEKAVRFREELRKRHASLSEVRCIEELREIAERAGL
jgi:hypothetical protein